MSTPKTIHARQFNPEGLMPLPKIRLFRVSFPAGDQYREDEMVEATGVGIEAQGVLKFSELVYCKNPLTGDWEMLQFVRRMFRIWWDVQEEVYSVSSSTVN